MPRTTPSEPLPSEADIVAQFARSLSCGVIVGIGRVDTGAWRVEFSSKGILRGFRYNWRDAEGPDPFTAMHKGNLLAARAVVELVASELSQ
jgi:hypothetical protein